MHRFRYDCTRPARSYTPGLPSSRIVSVGKSGGEEAVGLERPTFVERVIAAITLTGVVAVLRRAAVDYFLLR